MKVRNIFGGILSLILVYYTVQQQDWPFKLNIDNYTLYLLLIIMILLFWDDKTFAKIISRIRHFKWDKLGIDILLDEETQKNIEKIQEEIPKEKIESKIEEYQQERSNVAPYIIAIRMAIDIEMAINQIFERYLTKNATEIPSNTPPRRMIRYLATKNIIDPIFERLLYNAIRIRNQLVHKDYQSVDIYNFLDTATIILTKLDNIYDEVAK